MAISMSSKIMTQKDPENAVTDAFTVSVMDEDGMHEWVAFCDTLDEATELASSLIKNYRVVVESGRAF